MTKKVKDVSYVPVGPLRDKFLKLVERGESNASEVAARAGWLRSDTGQPDSTRVRRALGLRACITHGGATVKRKQENMRYETAVILAEALDMDPFEAGV